MFAGRGFTQPPGAFGSATTLITSQTLADDATYTLPVYTNAMFGIIVVGADEERVIFSVDNSGNVFLMNASASVVANANTDGKFCIGTGVANPVVIKNRLGSSKAVLVNVWYS